jgi:hypothetical protein
MNFSDIEAAFYFVSSGRPHEHSALLSRETGQIYYVSELGDSDKLPDDVEDEPEKYVRIRHKDNLGLGMSLVFSFVAESLLDEFDTVQRIFRSKGAYSRFKSLLEEKGLLEAWYKYEDSHQKEALRQWCIEQKIEIEGS